jgi:hypothetical protein
MSTPTEAKTCTKKDCTEPRAGEKPWCKKHLAEYQREYMQSKEGRLEAKGFVAGVSAMREYLISQFSRFPTGSFLGVDVMKLIRGAKGPAPD